MGDMRLNLSLLAGLLVCCGGWFFFEKFGGDFFRTSEVCSDWPDAERIAAVDHVSIDTANARIGLLRQHDRWIMTAPFPTAVDQSVVKRFLDVVSSTRSYDCLSQNELKKRGISLNALNLEKPAVRVSLEGAGRRFEFKLGSKSKQGERVYAMEKRTGAICVFPGSFSDAVPISVNDVRSRRLIDVDPSSIREVEVRSPGSAFVRIQRTPEGWVFAEPIKETADGVKISAAISALYTNRIETFLWPSVSNVLDAVESDSIFRARLPQWGTTAELGVSVRFRTDISETPVSLIFGSAVLGQSGFVYALLPDGESVGLVPLQLKDNFQDNLVRWRDHRIFTENISDVNSVKIDYPGEYMKIQRFDDSLWKIVSPSADFADQSAVSEFVKKLLAMESLDKTNAQSVAQNRLPAGEGASVCRVELGIGDKLRKFSVIDNGEDNKYTIKFDDSEIGHRVSAASVPAGLRTFMSLLSLYDKTMLSLPLGGIKRLTRSGNGGASEVAERNTDGKWLCGDKDVTETVKPIAEILSSLKSGAIAKPVFSLDDLDKFGLRTPWLEIVIDIDAVDSVRRTLQIGNSDGQGMRYALIGGTEALFLISDDTAMRLSGAWL